jgi:16S rRNA G966 N2-methylase RsmD
MSVADLALQRNKYKHLTDDKWRWFLQQVEGKERTAEKLPTFAAIPDWWYPVRLSCEQCSSELAARYKASLISGEKMVDLTGGYGVDTYFLSENFAHTDYVEQNEELCRIATHNFTNKPIAIHHTSAEEFLASTGQYDLIFLDPARRDSHGSKVFRLEDCTPNVIELLPTLLQHGKRLMIKLSPMLDLTQALKNLSTLNWDIYVVAIKNEVKELLLLSGGTGQITAIDLTQKDQAFVFTREQESLSAKRSCSETVFQCNDLSVEIIVPLAGKEDGQEKRPLFLYEPNAAILKAGAYKLIAERFGLSKLDVNTHLYCSDKLVENFPGRAWQIKFEIKNQKFEIKNANILCRNYPLTPEALKKKLHLRDGGTAFVIGCRVAGKPTLFYAERV